MAFRYVVQISSLLLNLKSQFIPNVVTSFRNYASKPVKKASQPTSCCAVTTTCPKNTSCKKPEKKKESFWTKYLCGKREVPPVETCRMKQAECRDDPDLSHLGGTAFGTCGTAYIIQREMIPAPPCGETAEQIAIRKMEADMDQKDNVADPMPEFTSVEQRMIDLNEKRLHPFYKRYMHAPKRRKSTLQFSAYKTRNSGPILPHEIPVKLKFNRDLLDKKNLFADFKRVEPPRQLVARMVEIQQNAKPTMEKSRMPVIPSDAQESVNQRRSVFDTLYQKDTKF